MRRYVYWILVLFLLEICDVHGLTMHKNSEDEMASKYLWAELKENRLSNTFKGSRYAQRWNNEHGGKFTEKRGNVKKWWWLLYSDRPKQQQKWKKGSTSLVCYFKVCAVPAPV